MPDLRVKKGDTVRVLSGKDRGREGKVIRAIPRKGRVLVEGVNAIKKHTRVTTNQRGAQSGGIITQEAPIHASNVAVVCPNCSKPTRVGHRREQVEKRRTDGSTYPAWRSVRICRRCGDDL